MKKILITGKNSYIGENVECWLNRFPNEFKVDTVDTLNDNWKKVNLSNYDVVFNVSAIVHRPKETDLDKYLHINRDLAVDIAKQAKLSGVKQFIQMSTDAVFGIDLGEVYEEKGYHPYTPYGISKYEADLLLKDLRSNDFCICIIRPPIVYGNGCKGNFPRLEKFALNSPIFPSINNIRDFIYIENLCSFIEYAIRNKLNETCYPRNKDRISVSDFVKKIADSNGRKIYLVGLFNPFIKLVYKYSHTLTSVFGSYYCVEKICKDNCWEPPFNLADSLKRMY